MITIEQAYNIAKNDYPDINFKTWGKDIGEEYVFEKANAGMYQDFLVSVDKETGKSNPTMILAMPGNYFRLPHIEIKRS